MFCWIDNVVSNTDICLEPSNEPGIVRFWLIWFRMNSLWKKKESEKEKELASIDLHKYFIILHTHTHTHIHKQHISHLPFITYSYVAKNLPFPHKHNTHAKLPKNPEEEIATTAAIRFKAQLIWHCLDLEVSLSLLSTTPCFQGVMAVSVSVCECDGWMRDKIYGYI